MAAQENPSTDTFASDGHAEVVDGTLGTSKARTASWSSKDHVNLDAAGIIVFVDVTDVTAGPSIVVTIEGKDPASGKYYTILASAAYTTNGSRQLRVSPNIAASANLIAQDHLPATWRVTVTHGNANAGTYSIGASLLD